MCVSHHLSVCLSVSWHLSYLSVCLSVCMCQLMAHLPARAEGSSWHLLYSSSVHGYSLRTLYRLMMGVDSPILLIVMDTDHHVSLSHHFHTKVSHCTQWYSLAAKKSDLSNFHRNFFCN